MNSKIFEINILEGMPPYGPPAINFSSTGLGTHKEGTVVEFISENEEWIGNFTKGGKQLNQSGFFADEKTVFVIAGGEVYIVDPVSKKLLSAFGGDIEGVFHAEGVEWLVFQSGVGFTAVSPEKEIWDRRVSWDGLKDVRLNSGIISGEAWDPSGTWYPFSLDILSGSVQGGSYFE